MCKMPSELILYHFSLKSDANAVSSFTVYKKVPIEKMRLCLMLEKFSILSWDL